MSSLRPLSEGDSLMTKEILCTLGPSSMNDRVIPRLEALGVSLFRINLSHTKLENVEECIRFIQARSKVPICLDTEGAQIRNQNVKTGAVELVEGDSIRIHCDEVEGDSHHISFTPAFVASSLSQGDILAIDFNSARIQVSTKDDSGCNAIVISGGRIGSNKAVELNRDIDLPPLTDKDRRAIAIGKKNGIRHYALSFANSQNDVRLLREFCGADATIISKIESIKGLKNLQAILDSSDAILIDRGDLSRQVAFEKIPFAQRRIISIAKSKRKLAYVATNLLESMVTQSTPTRAELNDIVSTLLMGADGLVLAAETAIGKYPIECIEMVKKIINEFNRWTPHTTLDELLEDN